MFINGNNTANFSIDFKKLLCCIILEFILYISLLQEFIISSERASKALYLRERNAEDRIKWPSFFFCDNISFILETDCGTNYAFLAS